MPTTYAHYKFGNEVISALPRPLQSSIENHRELFDIGVHGPDILFYYQPIKKNRVSGQGKCLKAWMTRLQHGHISTVLSAILPWTANAIHTLKR